MAFVGNLGEGETRDYTAIGEIVTQITAAAHQVQPGELLVLPPIDAAVAAAQKYARTGPCVIHVFPRLSEGHRVPTLDLSQRRENKMATKHISRDGLRKTLAVLAIGAALLAACGTTGQALSGTAQKPQRASVVHDPSNPYWVGSAAGDLGAGTESADRPSVIRDPDNPYWRMSTNAPADTYADPIHGDR